MKSFYKFTLKFIITYLFIVRLILHLVRPSRFTGDFHDQYIVTISIIFYVLIFIPYLLYCATQTSLSFVKSSLWILGIIFLCLGIQLILSFLDSHPYDYIILTVIAGYFYLLIGSIEFILYILIFLLFRKYNR